MSLNEQDILLQYYTQELTYLRKAGATFAARYPKIAARLELDKEECADPHIERLIEAFAFLTGRVQYNIDSEFIKFTAALLEILYPHYVQPIPAITIAHFEVDPSQGQFTNGLFLPKNTGVSTQETSKGACHFRTCYPITLWPLEVSDAQFESRNKYDFIESRAKGTQVLRIRFSCFPEIVLKDLKIKQLRVHLNESWLESGPLYELIFGELADVVLFSPNNKHFIKLLPEVIKPVGFEPDENILPYPKQAHPAYCLLKEYFIFSDKFLFFDLEQVHQLFVQNEQGEFLHLQEGQQSFEVLLFFQTNPNKIVNIDKNSFKLGCAPIVNLFSRVSEPLRVDYRQAEYRLIGDAYRESTTEIHSVIKVSVSRDTEANSMEVQPFFSFKHQLTGQREHQAFWVARRVPTHRLDLGGTDMLLSFLDLKFTPTLPAEQTVFAHVFCTNRDFIEQVQLGTELQLDKSQAVKNIYCLKHPTAPISPPLEGATVWRIISHLSLNYLSLTENQGSLAALKEILRLYNLKQDKSLDKQIEGLRKMSAEPKVGRIGSEAWRGFVRGFEITLEFDRDYYEGGSALLFACVLERFLALYVSANSFTRLIIKEEHSSKEEVWKKWPPRPGDKIQL